MKRCIVLLSTAPGRLALAGLLRDWPDAGVPSVQQALHAMRLSGVTMRRQVYQALRGLTNAAYYADASTWALLGYPGPRPLA